MHIVDARVALRDALTGIEVPASWLRSKSEVDELNAEMQAKQQAQEEAALAQQAGEAGQAVGGAAQVAQELDPEMLEALSQGVGAE